MAFNSIRSGITFARKNLPVLIPRNYLTKTSQCCAAGVDDQLFGLSESQQELRQTVYDFCLKELVPYAEKIDKDNGWDQLRYDLFYISLLLSFVILKMHNLITLLFLFRSACSSMKHFTHMTWSFTPSTPYTHSC